MATPSHDTMDNGASATPSAAVDDEHTADVTRRPMRGKQVTPP